MKRQRVEIPSAGLPSMLPPLPSNLVGDDLSDDEDAHRHKNIPGGSKLSMEAKRSQHCEVEKRRREKMNRYMTELAQMIPACSAVPRKLDKLSILKMAVDHMKNLRGDPHSGSEYKPGFLTDDELKQLVVEAANGFMVIISCEKSRVLFVSDTMNDVLHESPENWLGCSFYDLLHPKDVQKVKEQLACFDVEEAIAASVRQNCTKSPLVMHPQSMNGLRRSFLCRVKREGECVMPDSTTGGQNQDYQKAEDVLKLIQSSQNTTPHQYAVLHVTGFIRDLTPAERQTLEVDKEETGACLVAVARLQHFGDSTPRSAMSAPENEFVARIGTDGRFTYVDPRVAGVLGYLPQDLIGQVSYEYYNPDDIQKMVQLHHEVMKTRGPMPTVHYRFLTKKQSWVWLAMKAFSFVNPFSQQVEYIVCTNVAHTKMVDSSTDQLTNGESMATDQQISTSQSQQNALGQSVDLPDLGPNATEGMPALDSTSPALPSSVVVSVPANTTIEDNALAAQKILDEYNRVTAPPQRKKDMNYSFPPGLFTAEVDLEGSELAFRNLLEGLETDQDLQDLLNQIDADPFKPSNIFSDLDFDIFD